MVHDSPMTLANHNSEENVVRSKALRAIRSRDPRQAGSFVYGVKTTGIYCLPTCGSRPARA
jgi:AraC family transcriptional regulator of adaptative response/methylated-DNA-[protein]-cysteine methyltransferase